MNWSKEKSKQASKNPSSSGCWCVFVPLSETEGVKFYHNEETRDKAAALQRKAFDVGLGPAVGGFCEMPFLDTWTVPYRLEHDPPTKVYGYITEMADAGPMSHENYQAFCAWASEYDISTDDTSSGMNIGMLRGAPVRFDFDPFFYNVS